MNVSAPTEPVKAWLDRLPPDKRSTVDHLRRVIASIAPESQEILYHDALGYGPSESGFDRVFYVAVFARHINLGFFYGGALHDPDRLLRGEGKRLRHIRLTCPQEAEEPAVERLLRSAWPDGLLEVAQRRRILPPRFLHRGSVADRPGQPRPPLK